MVLGKKGSESRSESKKDDKENDDYFSEAVWPGNQNKSEKPSILKLPFSQQFDYLLQF